MNSRAIALATIALVPIASALAGCSDTTAFGAPCDDDADCETPYVCALPTGLCAPRAEPPGEGEGEGEAGEGEGEGEAGEGEGEGECGGVALYRIDFENSLDDRFDLTVTDNSGIQTVGGALALSAEPRFAYAEAVGAFAVPFDEPVRVRVALENAGEGVTTLAVQPFGRPEGFEAFIEVQSGAIRVGRVDGGERVFAAQGPYDPALHTWWQIRRDGGQIHFEAAGPDLVFAPIEDMLLGDLYSVVHPLLRFENVGDIPEAATFDDLGGGGAPTPLCSATQVIDPLDDPNTGSFRFESIAEGCILEESADGVRLGVLAEAEVGCGLLDPAHVVVAGAPVAYTVASPTVGTVDRYKFEIGTALYLRTQSQDGTRFEGGLLESSLFCRASIDDPPHFRLQTEPLGEAVRDQGAPLVITMVALPGVLRCEATLASKPEAILAAAEVDLPDGFVPAPARLELRADASPAPPTDASVFFTGVNAP